MFYKAAASQECLGSSFSSEMAAYSCFWLVSLVSLVSFAQSLESLPVSLQSVFEVFCEVVLL